MHSNLSYTVDVSVTIVVFVQEMMSKNRVGTTASSRVTEWDAPSSTLAAQTSPVHLQALLAPLELASAPAKLESQQQGYTWGCTCCWEGLLTCPPMRGLWPCSGAGQFLQGVVLPPSW